MFIAYRFEMIEITQQDILAQSILAKATANVGIIAAIREANATRHIGNLGRRLIKLSEEIGEHAEAYLNVTSVGNGKGKTWDDVREEAADMLIVAVDVALTPMSDAVTDAGREKMETDLIRRLVILHNAMPRVYQNYERFTLRAASTLGDMNHHFVRGSLEWEQQVMGYMVAAAFDLALTPLPDQADWDSDALEEQLAAIIAVKLAKWRNSRDTGKAASDAE